MARLPATLARWKAPLVALAQAHARLARAWAFQAHRLLMALQWGLPPEPEHFQQEINLYYSWMLTRDPMWAERGVFGALTLRGGDLLDLACGDGFYDERFYSSRARRVIAVDFDPAAIAVARRDHAAPNVSYVLQDIREGLPRGPFSNVIWNGAIEHFTEDETRAILTMIKERLEPGGVLAGYTIIARADGTKSLSHHEYEFQSVQDARAHLAPFFQNVRVFTSRSVDRTNLYFWAADGPLPFEDGWEI